MMSLLNGRVLHSVVLTALACLVLFLALTDPAQAARKKDSRNQGDDSSKYAAFVMDAATGEVLLAENANNRLYPASLTKMMTLLLTFDALTEKRIRLTDYIRISNHAASMSPSRLGLRPGSQIRVDEAIRAVSVKSANDIAVALAEALELDESRFANKMTIRARQIGMTGTQFVNASGLHSPFQKTTARDMAILGRYLIVHYPRYYRYFGLRSFSYAGKSHPNHNKLMSRYPGMDGMKTGYISQSGFNLVASVKRGDRRLIGVVFGGRTGRSRDDHMAKILDQAFARPPRAGKPKIDPGQLPPLPPTVAQAPAPLAVVPSPVASSSMPVETPPAVPAVAAIPAPAAVPSSSGAFPSTPAPAAAMLSKPVLDKKKEPPAARPVVPPPSRTSPKPPLPPQLSQTLGRISVNPSVYAASPAREYTAQIGAYQSRAATDRALYAATKKLPRDLRHADPIVAPLKTMENGWMFRARLGNLTKAEATRVCRLFSSCLVLSP